MAAEIRRAFFQGGAQGFGTIDTAPTQQACRAFCLELLGQAAVGALTGPQGDVENLRRSLEERRNALLEALGHIPGVRVTAPEGTFYSFPDFSACDSDSLRLSAFLLEKARVITVPGIEFGRDGHLRLSYCGALEDIVEGARRIRWALDPGAPREISFGGRTEVRTW